MLKRQLKLPQEQSFFLFGPRQTGKSTLLKENFSNENSVYYDLLKSEFYNKYLADPSIFREEVLTRAKCFSHIIVDEIQRIPALLNEIHYLLESKNPPIFCLSGSSARKLKRAEANLLGGRALTYSLQALTYKELGEKFNLERALNLGTLPAIFLSETEELAKEKLRAYVNTYLEEEIKAEALVRNLGSFLRFLQFAANENGNMINYSNIARETATKAREVKEYFQILEDTLLGFTLPAYAKSTRVRLSKHPKFYFFDTGVQRALAKRLTLDLSKQTPEYGKVFEHFIIREIVNICTYARNDYEFSFYRTEDNAEVDLIIETPSGELYAIEIKSKENPLNKDLRGLKSFRRICPKAKLICICQSPIRREMDGIDIYPWEEFISKEEIF